MLQNKLQVHLKSASTEKSKSTCAKSSVTILYICLEKGFYQFIIYKMIEVWSFFQQGIIRAPILMFINLIKSRMLRSITPVFNPILSYGQYIIVSVYKTSETSAI